MCVDMLEALWKVFHRFEFLAVIEVQSAQRFKLSDACRDCLEVMIAEVQIY